MAASAAGSAAASSAPDAARWRTLRSAKKPEPVVTSVGFHGTRRRGVRCPSQHPAQEQHFIPAVHNAVKASQAARSSPPCSGALLSCRPSAAAPQRSLTSGDGLQLENPGSRGRSCPTEGLAAPAPSVLEGGCGASTRWMRSTRQLVWLTVRGQQEERIIMSSRYAAKRG